MISLGRDVALTLGVPGASRESERAAARGLAYRGSPSVRSDEDDHPATQPARTVSRREPDELEVKDEHR